MWLVSKARTQQKGKAREAAVVLDTALVQAFLGSGQSSLAKEILKSPNYCDLAACEEVMVKGGHYSELIELYRSNQNHREALQLLNRLAQDSSSEELRNSQRYGPQDIVNYILVKMT